MQNLTLRRTKNNTTLPIHTEIRPPPPSHPPTRNKVCSFIVKFIIIAHLALIPGTTYQYFTKADACDMLQSQYRQKSSIPPVFHVQSPSVSSALTSIETWTAIYKGPVVEYTGQEAFEDHTHVVWTDASCALIISDSDERIKKIYSTLTETIQR